MGEAYLGVEQRPLSAVMPPLAQDVMTGTTGLLVAVLLLAALWSAWSARKNDTPLILLVSAAATVFLEPFACFMVKAHHPPVGAYGLFHGLDVAVPLQLLFFYILYFAPTGAFLIHRARKGISARQYWIDFLAIFTLLFGGEALAIQIGVWFFFDYNPFTLLGLPLWVALTNVTAVYAWAASALYCLERLDGAARWLMVVATPLAAVAVYGMVSLPAAMALYEQGVGYAFTVPAAIVSSLIGLSVVHLARPLMASMLSAHPERVAPSR